MNQQLIESSTTATRILVVDDEPSIVDAVATALRYEGFEVEEATNGRDAISAVEPWAVDSARSTESAPGIKDHDAVRRWVEAARG